MSSDNGAFLDLTSSPGPSSRSVARRGSAVVSTVKLADPSLNLADVRVSLSALQQGIDQTEALRELRSNHEDLRREFLALHRRAEDLDRQLADAANAASPYVLFCQHKNSRELEACRLRYRNLKRRYNKAVSEFHDRISTLEAQLASASSFGVIIPPDTARLEADMSSIAPRKQPRQQIPAVIPTVEQGEKLLVVSFDGS
ncbi:hypothetical protein PPTG_19993, partial [Phytophthora nicotianae INRA-310]